MSLRLYVNENGIKINTLFKFGALMCISPNSLECAVKNTILENSSNNDLLINRQAYLCKNKLKKVNVVVDGLIFKLNQITQSGLFVEKFIDFGEFDDNYSQFMDTVN